MTKLENIRQKVLDEQQQEEQREAKRAAITQQISDLDEQISKAIDDGQDAAARKLITKQNELKADLDFADRLARRKVDPNRYLPDLAKISVEHTAERQPMADKLYAELEKARKTYFEKKIALAKILYESVQNRVECMRWSGLGQGEPRCDEIACVPLRPWALDVPFYEKSIILQMEPQYFEMCSFVSNYGVQEYK